MRALSRSLPRPKLVLLTAERWFFVGYFCAAFSPPQKPSSSIIAEDEPHLSIRREEMTTVDTSGRPSAYKVTYQVRAPSSGYTGCQRTYSIRRRRLFYRRTMQSMAKIMNTNVKHLDTSRYVIYRCASIVCHRSTCSDRKNQGPERFRT